MGELVRVGDRLREEERSPGRSGGSQGPGVTEKKKVGSGDIKHTYPPKKSRQQLPNPITLLLGEMSKPQPPREKVFICGPKLLANLKKLGFIDENGYRLRRTNVD